MLQISYHRCEYDNCFYLKMLHDNSFILLLLYVDDMLIAYKNMLKIEESKSQLRKEFDMKDLEATTKMLCIEIRRDGKAG